MTPSAFAVLRFNTNSNLVGCWTGRSLDLAPFRIRSTTGRADPGRKISARRRRRNSGRDRRRATSREAVRDQLQHRRQRLPQSLSSFVGFVPALVISTSFVMFRLRSQNTKLRKTPGQPALRFRAKGRIGQRYSITSSARASSVGGIVRPRALAVLVLMTSSNLVGCTTGRSAGLSPLRMRPV